MVNPIIQGFYFIMIKSSRILKILPIYVYTLNVENEKE